MNEFLLERWQSLREHKCKINLSESGVSPLSLRDLGVEIPLDLKLGYIMTKGSEELRSLIAEYYGFNDPESIVVTNGTAEANMIVALSILKKGDKAVIQMPNYMQTYGLLEHFGVKVVEWWLKPEDNYRPRISELEELLDENVRAVFITNPNNPTGKVLGEKELKSISEIISDYDSYIVFDEVYRGLELNVEYTPSIVECGPPEKTIVTSGLSKAFGLPGLRVGWIVSSRKFAEKSWATKDYTTICISALSDYIARHVMQPHIREKLISRNREFVKRNLEIVERIFSDYREVAWIHRPDAGAFTLMSYVISEESIDLAEEIYRELSILVVPGECFNLKRTFRIGIGCESNVLVEGLKKVLDYIAEKSI